MKNNSILIFLTCIYLALLSCEGNEKKGITMQYDKIEEVPIGNWNNLSNNRIFFGHQSVGNNIVQGLIDIEKNYPYISLNVIETDHLPENMEGFFAHAYMGDNENPESKINAFKKAIDNGLGNNIDYAFLKFCFVDIDKHTDIEALFSKYDKMVEYINKNYPKTKLIHFTVPLIRKEKTSTFGKIKRSIKEFFGVKSDGFFDNINNVRRNEYNDMVRNKYKNNGPFFDIAELESTYPDGTRESFEYKGKIYYALAPVYTEDAGHLYGIGRQIISKSLLLKLVDLSING